MDENSSNLNNPVKNNEKTIVKNRRLTEKFDYNVIFSPDNTINERSFNDLKSTGDNMTKVQQLN